MSFAISGFPLNPALHGRRLVTWDAGRIGGDPDMVELVLAESGALHGRRVGPVEGPYTYQDHLRSDLSALGIMESLFLLEGRVYSGNLPERPPIPDGAIG